MGNWNFADIWEIAADELPDAPCLIHGDDRRTWAEVDRRADGVAQHLLDAGLERQQAVAQYLYNCNEYMESMYAAFKASFAPVNTNYRYTADELLYLWDNADAGAVVFHGSFTDTIEAIRDRLPKVRVWLWVDDDGSACPDVGDPLRGGSHQRRRPRRSRVGAHRRRPRLPLHRRHHRHAERRDVASGRPGRQADRHRGVATAR